MLLPSIVAAVVFAGGPAVVAADHRCNNQIATSLEDRVRDFETHVATPSERNDRYVSLQIIMSNADQESIILRSVCSETDYAPIHAQLLALQAWALLLESDINRANYAVRCPAAERPVAQALIANAWLLVVRAQDSGGGSYPSVKTIEAKVRPRAAAVGLTLPAPADTSAYWLSQIQLAATDVVSSCPK